jgi:hypothetical protein
VKGTFHACKAQLYASMLLLVKYIVPTSGPDSQLAILPLDAGLLLVFVTISKDVFNSLNKSTNLKEGGSK